jgi:hypothetical protein
MEVLSTTICARKTRDRLPPHHVARERVPLPFLTRTLLVSLQLIIHTSTWAWNLRVLSGSTTGGSKKTSNPPATTEKKSTPPFSAKELCAQRVWTPHSVCVVSTGARKRKIADETDVDDDMVEA